MDSLLQTGLAKGLLSKEEIISNASILLIAGAETIPTALSGTTFYLLKNPAAIAGATRRSVRLWRPKRSASSAPPRNSPTLTLVSRRA
jgi:cytochrome P450